MRTRLICTVTALAAAAAPLSTVAAGATRRRPLARRHPRRTGRRGRDAGLLPSPHHGHREDRTRARPDLPGHRRPLQARRRQPPPPGAGDPDHQRLRRQQARRRRGRHRPRLRAGGVRRAGVLRPRVRRLRLQDLPRRPGLRRPGRRPDGRRPRRHPLVHEQRGPEEEARLRRPRRPQGPAGRDDRRLLRRPDPVRGRDAGQARRRDRPGDHLARPALLPLPQQHLLHQRRAQRRARRAQEGLVDGVLRARRPAGAGEHPVRPGPRRGLPELPRRGLPGQGAAGHARLPRRRQPGAGLPRLRRLLPRPDHTSRRCSCRGRRTRCSTCRRRPRRSAACGRAAYPPG